MPQCNGEIGTLNQGEQVGGFYDWTLTVNKLSGQCIAERYWLLKQPSSDLFIVKLYQLIKGRLILIQQREVKVHIQSPAMKVINSPLTMILTK